MQEYSMQKTAELICGSGDILRADFPRNNRIKSAGKG